MEKRYLLPAAVMLTKYLSPEAEISCTEAGTASLTFSGFPIPFEVLLCAKLVIDKLIKFANCLSGGIRGLVNSAEHENLPICLSIFINKNLLGRCIGCYENLV